MSGIGEEQLVSETGPGTDADTGRPPEYATLFRLVREPSTERATLGKLYLDESLFCYTLEDVVREIKGVPIWKWKIPGSTAIPTGSYELWRTFSNRFRRVTPLVANVPGFNGIRIHPGNTDMDTSGCILVGTGILNGDFITGSGLAFRDLDKKIQEALKVGKVGITIG